MPAHIPTVFVHGLFGPFAERETFAELRPAVCTAPDLDATSKPEYEELLRIVFAIKPVHLVAGQRSSENWHVPGWAREHAATFTVLADAGHLMMLEQPAPLGRVLSTALGAVPLDL